ncbi:MAG TPA: caspase family protein, partial [Edaphobacter sp.]|nr:caspase family protein [Edaphobacter sp.]
HMAVKALCVGINQFKNYPQLTLRGCVNDAHDMATTLKTYLGFTDNDIITLTDSQATKQNIMTALKMMVADARAGRLNYIVFSMSSHGTQVPDKNGDESDHADEAFCPHDLAQTGNAWDTNHLIIDDELHDLFATLPQNVLLEVFLDTCHSGTGLKSIDLLLDRDVRFVPPPSFEAFAKVEHKQPRSLARKLQERGLIHHILWGACRADQTSADANIAGNWHGAFTYYFCQEMKNTKNKVSRSVLLQKVRTDLAHGHYSQIPQLECEATVRSFAVKQAAELVGA